MQRDSGGNLNDIIDTVAETIRGRAEIREKVRAYAAEGKASCYVLMALPIGLAFAYTLMNPGYLDPLFTTTIGTAPLVALGRPLHAVVVLDARHHCDQGLRGRHVDHRSIPAARRHGAPCSLAWPGRPAGPHGAYPPARRCGGSPRPRRSQKVEGSSRSTRQRRRHDTSRLAACSAGSSTTCCLQVTRLGGRCATSSWPRC